MATRSDSPSPATPPAIHPDTRVAIAVAQFHQDVTSKMLDGAVTALAELEVPEDRIQVVWVPGAFELPLACRWLAKAQPAPTAVAGLGCVIRGETDHYDFVCSEVARGTLEVSLELDVPVAFGVLTCNNMGQALARAGGDHGNKGADAVHAALHMAALRRRLAQGS